MKTRGQRGLNRGIFLYAAMAAVLISIWGPAITHGQDGFPTKPVEIIVPFGPGGIIDTGARIFSDALSRELKTPVVIKNVTGGGGLIGSTAFYNNTKPDGYTLLAASGGAVISKVLLSKSPAFDPRKDFLPVGYIADSPVALSVPKGSPFKTFDEFRKFAKSHPGQLKGGVSSLGGETHILFVTLTGEEKIDTKMIPYPATGQLVTAMLGEHLDWMTLSLPATMPYEKSGDVKILLLTSRSPELPGVPSGADVGIPRASVSIWMGLFALPQTPKPAYDKLVSAVGAACKDKETGEKLAKAGFNVSYKGPKDFSNLLNEQWDIFAKALEGSGLKKN